MKNLLNLFVFFFVFSAEAGLINLKTLTSFADEFTFQDNRKNLAREKIYSASKDCCGAAPFTVIEAYPDSNQKHFKQVALWCDHCGVKNVSLEQIQMCRERFTQLYKKFSGKDASEKLKTLVGAENQRQRDKNSDYSLRFSLGSLKCDTKGGLRVRVDFFADENKSFPSTR